MGGMCLLLLTCLMRKKLKKYYYYLCCRGPDPKCSCSCAGKKDKKKLKNSDETLFEQVDRRKKKDENLQTKLRSRACCMRKKTIQIQLENLGPISGVDGPGSETSSVEIPVSGVNGLGSDTSSEEIP